MLKSLVSSTLFNRSISLRFLNLSAIRLGDGDHTESKAKDKASQDLKSGKEKRWIDTVASDSGEIDE